MKRKTFYQFSALSLLTMLVLMVFPLVISVWLGFNFLTFRNINAPVFIGLRNYVDVLSDPQFWQAFRFTLLFIAITVPAQMIIGFVVALLLDQVPRYVRGFFLAATLLPFIVVPVVGTLMFRQLFIPSGLATWVLRMFFGQDFLFSEFTVKTLIVVHAIWYITPFPIVVFFAGLQTLPMDLIEASAIDGARRLQQIRHIVIPHLRSLIVLIALIAIMDMYREFDSIYVFTQRNPVYNANTVMMYNFQVAMNVQQLGKANAMSVLTVIGILVVLVPFLFRTYADQIEVR